MSVMSRTQGVWCGKIRILYMGWWMCCRRIRVARMLFYEPCGAGWFIRRNVCAIPWRGVSWCLSWWKWMAVCPMCRLYEALIPLCRQRRKTRCVGCTDSLRGGLPVKKFVRKWYFRSCFAWADLPKEMSSVGLERFGRNRMNVCRSFRVEIRRWPNG